VAIFGPGGSGKVALLEAMSGLRPPASGSVDRAYVAGDIGYVPQADTLHRVLPLTRALRYTAALRGVTDTGAVDDALRAAGLTGRSALPVGRLPDGERKLASIASELLTGPRLFFLDEPTSGLDAARDAELMRLLRRLVSEGATVVLTTNNPLDASRCDKVAVLAAGHLAFFGTPAGAREYFGADTLDEIYERLAGVGDPAEAWSRRFLRFSRTSSGVSAASLVSPAQWRAPRARGPAGPAGPVAPVAPAAPARPAAGAPLPLWQWALLTARNADVLARSRPAFAVVAGSPVAALLLFLALLRPGAFGPGVFWVVFGGFCFGLGYGLPQICAEAGVLSRERSAGVGAGAYVLAKAAVLLPLLAIADALFLVVLRVLGRLPGGGADYPGAFGALLLCSAAALGLGLLISAVVPGPPQAVAVLPAACLLQLLFAGAIVPVPAMAAAGRWISYLMTSRWAFEGLGRDLHGRPAGTDLLILAVFTVVFFAATIAVVIRKTR
jgi:ABC-type Mn2+/Zn2+ transport system ATPase subunit